jgi:hypothetical protein
MFCRNVCVGESTRKQEDLKYILQVSDVIPYCGDFLRYDTM